MSKIEDLIFSRLTVFTTGDLSAIWQIPERRRLLEIIKYYLRAEKLIRIYRGVYTLPQHALDYSPYELIQKVVPLSYISLATALLKYGITFQYEDALHAIALVSKKYDIDNKKIYYHQIKEDIFFNPEGLTTEGRYTIASPERAICDTLYIFPAHGFDNLSNINREKLVEISFIYKNKRLEKEIKNICSIEKNTK